jgi:hypothetical protein
MAIRKKNAGCVMAFAVVAMLGGCSLSKQEIPHATIDDISIGSELDPSYQIAEVDGKPVVRQSGIVNTVVPFAIVTPGSHVFLLKPEIASSVPAGTISISATVEAGKRYRLVRKEGRVSLVEDPGSTSRNAADNDEAKRSRPQIVQP